MAVKCVFESNKETAGVVFSKLRAYCPMPTLDATGEIQLTISVNGIVYHTYLYAGRYY